MRCDETQRRRIFLKYVGLSVLALLMLVSIAAAAPYAYITNGQETNVSVLDTATNNVIAKVNVGASPFGVAVNPDGTKAYITANKGNGIVLNGSVSVIDTATNEVTAKVDVESFARGVAVSPDGTKVYVANSFYDSALFPGNVSIIDTTTNKVIAKVKVGRYPEGIVVNPAGTKVYVANEFSNSVSVIDTATKKVITTVNVGKQPEGIAITPDGTKVYVTNLGNDVSVIDTATNTVTATVKIIGPLGVTVNPYGTKVYVTNEASNNVSVIDTATNEVTASVSVGNQPVGIAVTPDGTKVYVANSNSQGGYKGTVSVIDSATNKVTATIDVGKQPLAFGQFIVPPPVLKIVLPVANFNNNISSGYAPLSVQFNDSSENSTSWYWDFGDGSTSTDKNPTHTYSTIGNYLVNLTVSDGNNTDSQVATITVLKKLVAGATYAYVINSGSDTASVIDVATDTVIATIPVGNQPMGVAATLDGKKVYVTNIGNTVSVIDTATYNVIATMNASVPLNGLNVETMGVAVSPDGTKAYVACAYNINVYNGIVSVIDTTTNTIIATVNVGVWPEGIAVSPDGKRVYVTNQDSNTVSVIDTSTNTVIATVNGLNCPGEVAITPDGTKVYALNNNNTISVIDTTTNVIIATLNTDSSFCGIAFTSDGKKAYVTGYNNNVIVIDTDTNTVTANVIVGSFPSGVAITPDGKKVYVSNYDTDDVSVIDTATNAVIATVNVGDSPGAIGQFILLPAQSILPVANFSINVTEGYVPLSVKFTDLSKNAIGWNWDFGDGVSSNEQSPIHTFYTSGIYTVNLTTINSNGTNSKLATINISEKPELVLPVANFSTNVSEGSSPLSVQFRDVSENSTSRNWDFENDGNIDSTEESPVFVYANPGTYTVNLTAINANGTSSKNATINVLIPPPTINSIVVPLDPVPLSTSITASANVTYLGSFNDLTAEWDWGDGSTSVPEVSSNFAASHMYNSAGVYTVTFTLKDINNEIYAQTSPNYVVVYDPAGGFVTGGGWINSPAGAYVADNTLAGKATFGFVSKYQKGSSVPTGKTEFQFSVADLSFYSENYDWLVVAGSKAQYKGTGTINGEGNYGFMLSAVDGAIKGDNIDRFRIKIWDKENKNTIYDNEIKVAEDSEPSTVISGGSIIIHSKK